MIVLAAWSVGVGSYDEVPLVTVMQGALRGHYFTSRKGRQFVGFQGVPYAKPPLGELRFRVSRISRGRVLPTKKCLLFYLNIFRLINSWTTSKDLFFSIHIGKMEGGRDSTVVKVLYYNSEGRWFDPSWCQWIFHRHKILLIALWTWGRLSL